METNEIIQKNVADELAFDPRVDSSEIGVNVKDGVVFLLGHVSIYREKLAAERATRRVYGVRAVVNQLEVSLLPTDRGDDAKLATDALAALRLRSDVPASQITVVVNQGWIKLEGDVEWNYQRAAAEKAVRNLRGVKGISNYITITPSVKPDTIEDKIAAAFKRDALIDASSIKVYTSGASVTLKGTIHSWAEHDVAVAAAWSAPGVTNVIDELEVELPVAAW